jgi:hypothetical protein
MHTTRTTREVWRFRRWHVGLERTKAEPGGVLHGEWIWSHGISQRMDHHQDARVQPGCLTPFLGFRFEGGGNVGAVSAFCLISFPSSNPARLFGAATRAPILFSLHQPLTFDALNIHTENYPTMQGKRKIRPAIYHATSWCDWG